MRCGVGLDHDDDDDDEERHERMVEAGKDSGLVVWIFYRQHQYQRVAVGKSRHGGSAYVQIHPQE